MTATNATPAAAVTDTPATHTLNTAGAPTPVAWIRGYDQAHDVFMVTASTDDYLAGEFRIIHREDPDLRPIFPPPPANVDELLAALDGLD